MTAAETAQPASGGIGSAWFWRLVRQELALDPGRLSIIGRIVASAAIITLVVMTFRLPSASLAAFYTFILSRESPRATLQSGLTLIGAFLAGASFALLGVTISVDYPLTHFLWVTGTIFAIFFVIRVVPNYAAAAAFSFVIATAIPAWDLTGPTEPKVYATLWTTWCVAMGILITVAFEYVVRSFGARDDLLSAIDDRLSGVEAALRDEAAGRPVGKHAAGKLKRYASVGSSRLRQVLARSTYEPKYAAQMNATVSLVDALVDLAANLSHVNVNPGERGKADLNRVADRVAEMRRHLIERTPPPMFEPESGAEIPLLAEIERTAGLIGYGFAGDAAVAEGPPNGVDQRKRRAAPWVEGRAPWVEDAFRNPEHLRFALKGTMAAMASYIIYNALQWPGISTCLATCVITALSNVGASRQKQLLRITGAVIGGLIGLTAQTLIFPGVDSITGFLLVSAAVTAFAAWINTSTPRIAYIGLQIALAWDLINLSDPAFQLSLAIARDRVVGILLGIVCMWIFFEPFWAEAAAQQMLEIFAANLEMLARLPVALRPGRHRAVAIHEIRSIRDQVGSSFGAVNAQADAVQFETGPERAAQLKVRERVLQWQPRLGTLMLLQVAVLRYRIGMPEGDIAPEILDAQREFDNRMRHVLLGMARTVEGLAGVGNGREVESAYRRLEDAVREHYRELPASAASILELSRLMVEIVRRLAGEIEAETLPLVARRPREPENTSPTMETR